MIILASLALLFTAIPALLFLRNLREYTAPPSPDGRAAVSVLIPARDEEKNIRAAVEAVLRSESADLEVIVLDDHSSDATAEITQQLAHADPCVRLIRGEPLPAGWCGKQFACHQLAAAATKPTLLFVDADVRLSSDAVARCAQFLKQSDSQLASGVPYQQFTNFSDRLLIPLIHFVLLGFLPFERMRRSSDPAYATGCGQLFVADAAAYQKCGGHEAIRGNIHDGLALPRLFRKHGFKTDLFDATSIAVCRMYETNHAVWSGLAKNATEGLAKPALIGPATLLLLGGHVVPWFLIGASLIPSLLAIGAIAFSLLPRVAAIAAFKQPVTSALLHPLAILSLVGIQWFALVRARMGKPSSWKGRSYAPLAKATALLLMIPAFAHAAPFQQLPAFELRDQHGRLHQYAFPKRKISVITVADHQGSAQLEPWIQAIHSRYEKRVDIDGVANMGPIPGPFHNLARRLFGERLTYPVMMDFGGSVSRRIGYSKNLANVMIVDRDGRVLNRFTGAANPASLQSVFEQIDKALSDAK